MLINPNTGAPNKGATVGGLRWSPRTGGSVIGAESVTNFNSKSNAFQTMNESIIRLDNAYEALPDKSSWIQRADTLRTVPVCGCASSDMSGKKLYRTTNYFRMVSSQSETSTAPPFLGNLVQNFNYWYPNLSTEPPKSHSIMSGVGAQNPLIAIPQFGRGNNNPQWLFIPFLGYATPINGQPADIFYLTSPSGTAGTWCWFQEDGLPVGQTNFRIEK